MISKYASLINQLPVRNIAFFTKRTTWKNNEAVFPWLEELNNDLFKREESIKISRHDIFNSNCDLRKLIILTIYWGFPAGMRGNHFLNILRGLGILEEALLRLQKIDKPSIDDYLAFRNSVKGIIGVGMSTYSKLLYFLEIKINGFECLILDQRLLDAFSNEVFSQLMEFKGLQYGNKAELKYPEVIEKLHNISRELGFKPENLEMFLFLFGKNLQPINTFQV